MVRPSVDDELQLQQLQQQLQQSTMLPMQAHMFAWDQNLDQQLQQQQTGPYQHIQSPIEYPTYSLLGQPERVLCYNTHTRDKLPLFSAESIGIVQQLAITSRMPLHAFNEDEAFNRFKAVLGVTSGADVFRHIFRRFRQMPERDGWMQNFFSPSWKQDCQLAPEEVQKCRDLLHAVHDRFTLEIAMLDLCTKTLFRLYFEENGRDDPMRFHACCEIEAGKWYTHILYNWIEEYRYANWLELRRAGSTLQYEKLPMWRQA